MRNRYLSLRKRRGHKKAIIGPVDRKITVEQAIIIARNQGYKIKSATV